MINMNIIIITITIIIHIRNVLISKVLDYFAFIQKMDLVFDLITIKAYEGFLKNLRKIINIFILFGIFVITYAPSLIFPFIYFTIGSLALFLLLVYWVYNYTSIIKFPFFHATIKYIILLLFLIVLFKIFGLINSVFEIIFNIIKYNIIGKIQIFKNFLENPFNNKFKNPRDPRNPKRFSTFYSDWRNKRRLKKLKDKVIKKQSYNYTNNILDRNTSNINNNNRIKRDWNKTLDIKEEFLSKSDVLDNIQEKFEFYKDQKERFERTINNISQKNEGFYSNDSVSLFKEYVNLIDFINQELKTMEEQVKNTK